MFVLLAIGLLLAALAGQGFAEEKILESKWTGVPMMIDGLDSEWQGEALNTDDDGMVDYALRNDGAHLYLLFVIKDPKFLSSINATGLTVYLSPEAKKSKDHGLRFIRKPVPAEQLIASMERTGEILTEEKKAEMRAKKFYLVFQSEVIDKNPDKKISGTEDAPAEPPMYRAMTKDKLLVYECRIPLGGASRAGGLGMRPGETLKIGFEWGGMTDEMKKARLDRRAAAESQASAAATDMESRLTGDLESLDMEPGGASGYSRSPKKYSFWVDVKLAAPSR
jgi:hypothetical protein